MNGLGRYCLEFCEVVKSTPRQWITRYVQNGIHTCRVTGTTIYAEEGVMTTTQIPGPVEEVIRRMRAIKEATAGRMLLTPVGPPPV